MRTFKKDTTHWARWLAGLLILVALAPLARAAGNVATCDEASLNTALSGGGAVTFSCSGTITVTAPKIIAANTTIDGTGQLVTLNGNNTFRLFQVNSGISASFSNLTFTGGPEFNNGGAIFNSGTATISNSTFLQNSA